MSAKKIYKQAFPLSLTQTLISLRIYGENTVHADTSIVSNTILQITCTLSSSSVSPPEFIRLMAKTWYTLIGEKTMLSSLSDARRLYSDDANDDVDSEIEDVGGGIGGVTALWTH